MKASTLGAIIGSSLVMFVITAGGEYGKRVTAERNLEAAMEQVEDLDQTRDELADDLLAAKQPWELTPSERAHVEYITGQIPVYTLPVYTLPVHNAVGGYVPACGELPGLVGDDC